MAGVARTTLGRYLNRFTEKRLLQSQSAFNLTESRRGAQKQCYNLQHSLYKQLNSENNPVKGSLFVFFSAQPQNNAERVKQNKIPDINLCVRLSRAAFSVCFPGSGALFTCCPSAFRDDRFHRAVLLVLLMNDVFPH